MYDIADIISQLQTATTYTIKRAKSKEPITFTEGDLPIIYVGFRSLDSESPTTPISQDLYDEHGTDLVQTFDIHINCMEENLPTIHRALYAALVGKNFGPSGSDQQSGFAYKQGGVIGLENGTIWWIDVWHIGYPSLYMFP